MNNKGQGEQKYFTKIFNSLGSAESFKKKCGSEHKIRVYKDGKFGVKCKIDKTKPKRKNTYTYDKWWSKSNLDGTFAYNGVTEDF